MCKKCVLRSLLKEVTDSATLMGRAFHRPGATCLKDLSLVFVLGTGGAGLPNAKPDMATLTLRT
jgi:hypothetical protein